MKATTLLAALFLVAVACAAQDLNRWTVTGRVAALTETSFPDGGKIVSVTLGNIDREQDGVFSRYISFDCSIFSDCRPYILGTCSKRTITATTTSPEGVTTFRTTACLNQHYADCWTFSGYMTPQLWATNQAQSYGCNF